MSNSTLTNVPSDLQQSITQTNLKIQEMQAAAQLAKSLTDMGPALTEITTLANNLVTTIGSYRQQLLHIHNKQNQREVLVRISPVIQTQLGFMRDMQKDLYRLLENASEADKDRYLSAIMESMGKACDLITNLIAQT